jgi:pantothenate kinase
MLRQTNSGPPAISSVDELLAMFRSWRRRGARTLVGIVGPPGSGKSHLAHFLAAIVAQDGFHLANDVLVRLNRRDRKGAPDTFDVDGLINLLDRLRARIDGVVYAPVFRRDLEESINAAVPIGADVDVVIVEGNYLLLEDRPWWGIAERLDVTLYVETSETERRRRLLDRQRRTYGSVEAAEAWLERVDQPNARLVEATRHRADAVVQDLHLPVPSRPHPD